MSHRLVIAGVNSALWLMVIALVVNTVISEHWPATYLNRPASKELYNLFIIF
jgi:hypothetical protein